MGDSNSTNVNPTGIGSKFVIVSALLGTVLVVTLVLVYPRNPSPPSSATEQAALPVQEVPLVVSPPKEPEIPSLTKEKPIIEESVKQLTTVENSEEELIQEPQMEKEKVNEPTVVEDANLAKIEEAIKPLIKLPIFNNPLCSVKDASLEKLAKLFAFLRQRGDIEDLILSNLSPINNMKSTLAMMRKNNLTDAKTSGQLFLACLPLTPVLVCGNSTTLVNLAIKLHELSDRKFSLENYLQLLKLMREQLLQETQALYYQNDSLPDLTEMLLAYSENRMTELDSKIIDAVGRNAFDFLDDLNNYKIDEDKLKETKEHLAKLYKQVV